MPTVTSRDGTTIAFEQSGQGPALILVAPALADRTEARKLASLLSERFTVISYDRRGRGDSGDSPPYRIEREVEDIEALIDEIGGSALVFGSSSGAVLALEASHRLPTRVRKQVLFEPPFIVDDSRRPIPDTFAGRIEALLEADRRGDAVKLFFAEAMGIPSLFVSLMRLMPGWSKMRAMAHTLPYDLALLHGTQCGEPLPAERWASTVAPTLVLTGEKSEPFFHRGGEALEALLPDAHHGTLKGQGHAAVQMGASALARVVTAFFGE